MRLLDKIDLTSSSTATAATAAATSPVWLSPAQHVVTVAAHPIWAELLAPLGVLWLAIQIGFFIYGKWAKRSDD